MKKIVFLLLMLTIVLGLTACSYVDIDSLSSSELERLIVDDENLTIITSPTTTQPSKPLKPINERILCFMCFSDNPKFNSSNTEEVDIYALYEKYDTLKCCVCGAVDGEDYKAGDTIFVLTE